MPGDSVRLVHVQDKSFVLSLKSGPKDMSKNVLIQILTSSCLNTDL